MRSEEGSSAVDGMTDMDFVQSFAADCLPACPEGMMLLRRLGEGSPTVYALAARTHFIDPIHPAVLRSLHWLAYARHCSTCESCNEV